MTNYDLRQALALVQAGDKHNGARWLAKVLTADPKNEVAWLWMASLVSEDERRAYCLRQVLRLNPDSHLAKEGLAQLRQKHTQQSQPASLSTRPSPPGTVQARPAVPAQAQPLPAAPASATPATNRAGATIQPAEAVARLGRVPWMRIVLIALILMTGMCAGLLYVNRATPGLI
jgi:hypothetical protein